MKQQKLIDFHLIGNMILCSLLLLTGLLGFKHIYAILIAVPLFLLLGLFQVFFSLLILSKKELRNPTLYAYLMIASIGVVWIIKLNPAADSYFFPEGLEYFIAYALAAAIFNLILSIVNYKRFIKIP